MEEIKINEKIYVLKSDFENEYVHKDEIKTKSDKFVPQVSCTDECNVMGLGSVEINSDWNSVIISIDFLERAIGIMKKVTYSNKKNAKRESVVLAITKNYPLLIGDIKDNMFSGVIIAPRMETE